MNYKEQYLYYKQSLDKLLSCTENTEENQWHKTMIDKFNNKYNFQNYHQLISCVQQYKCDLKDAQEEVCSMSETNQKLKNIQTQLKQYLNRYLSSKIGLNQIIEKFKELLELDKFNHFLEIFKKISKGENK